MGEFGPLMAGLFSMAPFGNPSRGTWVLFPQNYAEICGVVRDRHRRPRGCGEWP